MGDRRIVMKKIFKEYAKIIILEMIEELESNYNKKNKRLWTRKWLLRRDARGVSAGLLKELEIEDQMEYKLFMRMTCEQFNTILENISDTIQRSDTIMRESIPAKIKLQLTLSFLATGNSYRTLQHMFRVSKSSISKIIPEVLDAIHNYLKFYMKFPSTHEEWYAIEQGFNARWNFPGCYGAIDGKHVLIQAPPECGSDFFNYKGSNSIVLMAVVDHDYCFRYINVGANGRSSDGAIFQTCSLFRRLDDQMLPRGGFFVGDDAFPLKTYLLKPYSHKPLTTQQKIFNYRLSRARRIVENAFGILASRFRIFQKPISTHIDVTDKIIRTACTLHNWLRITSPNTYLQRNTVDEEDLNTGEVIQGTWRRENIVSMPSIEHNISTNHSARVARELRDRYADYFYNDGAVPWQNKMIY